MFFVFILLLFFFLAFIYLTVNFPNAQMNRPPPMNPVSPYYPNTTTKPNLTLQSNYNPQYYPIPSTSSASLPTSTSPSYRPSYRPSMPINQPYFDPYSPKPTHLPNRTASKQSSLLDIMVDWAISDRPNTPPYNKGGLPPTSSSANPSAARTIQQV